jgi:hypothetical protein
MQLKGNANKGSKACTTVGLQAIKHGAGTIAQSLKNQSAGFDNISATTQCKLDTKII